MSQKDDRILTNPVLLAEPLDLPFRDLPGPHPRVGDRVFENERPSTSQTRSCNRFETKVTQSQAFRRVWKKTLAGSGNALSGSVWKVWTSVHPWSLCRGRQGGGSTRSPGSRSP